MNEYFFSEPCLPLSLQIINCGSERCSPGHTFGPAIREHYLIHFVASGKGVFCADGKTWELRAGQGFLILPEEITTYRADASDPWEYAWVGYTGSGADKITLTAGLSPEKHVFSCQDAGAALEILRQIEDDALHLEAGGLSAVGGLLRFLACIPGRRPDTRLPRQHYDRARWYMEGHYATPITVQQVANFAQISRAQLYRLFQEAEGRSPKQALTALRLRHACRLLTETDAPLDAVAAQVGLASGQRLGVLFRKETGLSPGVYRDRMRR